MPLHAAGVSAQGIEAGDRVRLTGPEVPGSPAKGKVIEIHPEDLVVLLESGGKTLTLPGASLSRLEVARGKRSAVPEGIAVGIITGTLVGGAVGFGYGSICGLARAPELSPSLGGDSCLGASVRVAF